MRSFFHFGCSTYYFFRVFDSHNLADLSSLFFKVLEKWIFSCRFSSTIELGVQEHFSTFVLNNSLFRKCNLWIYVIVSASTIRHVLVAVQSELYRTSTLPPQKKTSSYHRKLSIQVKWQLLGSGKRDGINQLLGGIFSKERRINALKLDEELYYWDVDDIWILRLYRRILEEVLFQNLMILLIPSGIRLILSGDLEVAFGVLMAMMRWI